MRAFATLGLVVWTSRVSRAHKQEVIAKDRDNVLFALSSDFGHFFSEDALRSLDSALKRLRRLASRVVIASFSIELREMAQNFLCSAQTSAESGTGTLLVGFDEAACEEVRYDSVTECVVMLPKGESAPGSFVEYQSKRYLHSVLAKHVVFTAAVAEGSFD